MSDSPCLVPYNVPRIRIQWQTLKVVTGALVGQHTQETVISIEYDQGRRVKVRKGQ